MRYSYILFLLALVGSLVACSSKARDGMSIAKLPAEACVASFDTFAYTIPNLYGPEQEKILPLSPWRIEAALPETPRNGLFEPEIVRSVDSLTEIWIKYSPPTDYFNASVENPYFYLVYLPETDNWRKIPSQVENSMGYVDDLFIGEDGTIWGRNVWAYDRSDIKYPVLSRFNDAKGSFEFEQPTKVIPHGWLNNLSSDSYPSWDKVFLDEKGMFWIFVSRDAIYSYEPVSQTVTRQADLSGYKNVGTIILARNGNLYFTQRLPSSKLEQGRILEFIPSTKEIKQMDLPQETWLDPGNILLDRSGRLWLDAFGWRETDGTWQKLQPNMRDFVKKIGDEGLWTYYYPPTVFFESSDGRLWFGIGRSRDKNNFRTGIAWFNPQTKEGCWFTSEASSIVEDPQHRLWMIANNNLYTYSLDGP